jgi:hypothetical protein
LSNNSLPFVSIIVPARNEEKNVKKYNINAAYSLLTFPAALFLISAYLANMTPLFMSFKRSRILKVQWRHRTYIYKTEGLITQSSKISEIDGSAGTN